jgi:hypothetical protein
VSLVKIEVNEMRRIAIYDALAFGSGACGLTAAVTLAEGGAKVAVLGTTPPTVMQSLPGIDQQRILLGKFRLT